MSPLRLGVLVSGAGTNLQALIDAVEAGELHATIALVLSNTPQAHALVRAEQHGLRACVVSRVDYPDRAARHAAIQKALDEAAVGLVVLAGFTEVLASSFVRHFAGRMLNTHPSLLPAFGGGLHAVRDALAHGVKVSGCTVHFVTEAVDEGPIVVQRCVAVLDTDSVESLHARIREQEHLALTEAVALFAQGRLTVEGRHVRVAPPVAAAVD